jgi:hypothetical protein
MFRERTMLTSLSRITLVVVPLLLAAACVRPSIFDSDEVGLRDANDWKKVVALGVACKDGIAERGTSFNLELEELLADSTPQEEFQPFDEERFWMQIRHVTPKAIALTVRVEDEAPQEFEILFGERRVFRLQGKDKWISLRFYEYSIARD